MTLHTLGANVHAITRAEPLYLRIRRLADFLEAQRRPVQMHPAPVRVQRRPTLRVIEGGNS